MRRKGSVRREKTVGVWKCLSVRSEKEVSGSDRRHSSNAGLRYGA